jgi:hypothetical protein
MLLSSRYVFRSQQKLVSESEILLSSNLELKIRLNSVTEKAGSNQFDYKAELF